MSVPLGRSVEGSSRRIQAKISSVPMQSGVARRHKA
jgi:hypothetical protein